MLREDYGIKVRPITSRNPQANAILERVHQVIGNMLKNFQLYEQNIDEEDPWSGYLTAIMFAIKSTYHSTLKSTPTQLIFGRDAILPIKHLADWKLIKDRKQRLIDLNNKRENSRRIPHEYKVNDQVLITRSKKTKHGDPEYAGPYRIIQINNNGTVRIQKETYSDVINIKQVYPYHN